jgi:hypothetical protein
MWVVEMWTGFISLNVGYLMMLVMYFQCNTRQNDTVYGCSY